MNVWIIAGILLIALGTGLLYVGGQKQDRVVTGKIDEALNRMDSIRMRSDGETGKELEAVESEFVEWVNEFLSEKERRRLEFDRQRFGLEEDEFEQSDITRPLLEELVMTLSGLVQAYNEATGDSIEVELPTPPENLFETPYTAHVKFAEDVYWVIEAEGKRPARGPPGILIQVAPSPEDALIMEGTERLLITHMPEGFLVHLVWSDVWRTLDLSPWERASEHASLRPLLQTLFEAQLHLREE